MNKSLQMVSWFTGVILGIVVLLFGGLNLTQNRKAVLGYPQYTTFWLDSAVKYIESEQSAGTKQYPYLINTPEQLAYIAKAVNGGTVDNDGNVQYLDFSGVFFQLNADIDLSGSNWVPIGNEAHPFKGVFYGNGKKISNMVIDSTMMNATAGGVVVNDFRQSLGLFGYVGYNGSAGETASTINQLVIENAYINACEYAQYAGTVAGVFEGASLNNITIISPTSETSNDTTSAGAVIYHNLTDASVMSADFIAGGVVGKLGNSTSTTVANLSNANHDNEILTSIKSTIYDNNGYSVVLGGLVGENNGTLKESRRTGGEINAFIGTIGGLVGVNSASGKMLDCYNYGNILIDPLLPNGVSVDSGLNKAEETVIGGMAGKNFGSISIENFSAIYGTVEGQNVAQVFQTCRGLIGGIAGTSKGTIENITNFAFVKCTGDQVQYMGGITAINAGTIRKCVNKGIVGADGNTEFSAKAVGGITGLNDSASIGDGAEQLGDGKIYGVENKADTGININAENAGGIAGINASTGNITSYEAGVVAGVVRNLGNVQGTSAVGGIVGKNYGTVEYVYNTTNISCASNADSASVGGVVGIMSKGAIKNSFNVGQVLDGYNVGGFVGTMENRTARIENCINYGSVTGSRGYVGGFAGYIEAGALSKVIAICDVTENGDSPLGIGGVIGAVKLSNGAPDTGVTLENYFYSESIANYEEDEFGVTDNGMIAIGNTDINKWAKMDSYKMTLPYVESKMTGSDRYRSGLYKAGSTGAEIENTDWYFNTANETANTYYYPILRAFRAGETNSLNVYGATADAVKPENGLEYPSETIFRVEFRNNYPYWNVNAKDYEERVICEDRYVVNGHYTAEPNSDLYDKPAGFYMQWKQTDIDMTTAPQNWSFTNKVTRNMRIYIDWTEKTYTIKYYLQLNGVGEFVEMTAEEREQFGLSDSSTYSLDPNAKSSLNAINIPEPKLFGYSFDGWWISKTASGIGATLDETDKVTEFSRNEVYAEDIIYVYGKKTAETYTVYLYPGVNNSNIAMKFVDAQEGTPKVVTLTYGEAFDLSDIQAQLDYDPADITFKGWFSNEGTGGTQYTNTNSVSIGVFKLTGTGAIRWYAQWTDSMQKILFVSIDENGTEQNLGSTSVPFGNIFTYEQFVSQNLKYYVIDERGGYEIDRCFADASLLTLFDFNNNSITDRTTIYITWKKKFFSLRLNADGGAFSDDSTVYVINNIEYKSDFLGEVLNNLADTQMPARIGYKVKRVNDIAIWNEQPNGQGAVISYANNNYIMPAYDLNIYISWEVEKYTVQIVANGGLFTTENGSTPSINIALEYNTSLKQALDRYFVANALPTNEGYGFRYWSLQNAGIDDTPAPALTDSDKVPYLGTTVYATWGRQYIVKFKKIFYDDETSWLEIKVFEGDCVSEPDTSSTDFMVAGMDFVEWKQYMGTITNENGEKEQVYQAYDWLEPVTSDLILVGTWTPNGGKTDPIDTSNILIIAISIIAGIVVIMFVVILARSRKKGLEVSNKRLQTKNSKEKLEKIREIEKRRKNDNPFDF